MAAKKENFEDQLKRLQSVVEQLERGDQPLEKGVALYKEGIVLAKACREQLEKARNEIALFSEGALQPFGVSEDAEDDPAGD